MIYCRHGASSLVIAHSSMIPLQRSGAAGNRLLRPATTYFRLPSSALTSRMKHNMSYYPKKQLWNPAVGIRFSPGLHPRLPYPPLGMSRSIHPSNPRPSAPEENFLIDDEEFERDAAEWFDQQDALARATPSPLLDGNKDKTAGLKQDLETGKESNEPKGVLPPITSLDFTIRNDLFQAALKSKRDSPESFWSYTMYHRIDQDGTKQNVKVHYCTSKHTMEQVCQKYFLGEDVLGFDMEWYAYADRNSGVRKNVSLIQMASPSRIGLFHTAVFPKDDFVAPTFKKIMEDPGVSKVGVNISGDCTRLRNFMGVQTQGIFELSHLYKLVKFSKLGELNRINRSVVSMATQMEDVLRLPIYKGASVRTSNWMQPLDKQQLAYSASDAYAGLQLYYVLEEERQKLKPCPPRPYHAEKGLPIRVTEVLEREEEEAESEEEADEQRIEAAAAFASGLSKPPKAASATQTSQVRDPRIIAAEENSKLYRASKTTSLLSQPAALRAYYLWHSNEGLHPIEMARLLRDPPLKTATVVVYILDAIVDEKLPYDKARLSKEVLAMLGGRAGGIKKYRSLLEDVRKP